MNRLLGAEFPRAFKSKIFIISLILTAFMGFASVMTLFTSGEDLPNAAMIATSSSNVVMFLTMLMPIYAGGVGIILTAGEFSSGIIRNKLIMGHSRLSIYCSWFIVYTAHTVLSFIAYFGGYFAASAIFGIDLSVLKFEAVAGNLAVMFFFMFKFMLFCMMLSMIYPDVKSAVISYMLNGLAAMPIMLIAMVNPGSKAVKIFSRFFIYVSLTEGSGNSMSSSLNFLNAPDKPWLTIICTLGLGALYFLGGLRLFEKKEIK